MPDSVAGISQRRLKAARREAAEERVRNRTSEVSTGIYKRTVTLLSLAEAVKHGTLLANVRSYDLAVMLDDIERGLRELLSKFGFDFTPIKAHPDGNPRKGFTTCDLGYMPDKPRSVFPDPNLNAAALRRGMDALRELRDVRTCIKLADDALDGLLRIQRRSSQSTRRRAHSTAGGQLSGEALRKRIRYCTTTGVMAGIQLGKQLEMLHVTPVEPIAMTGRKVRGGARKGRDIANPKYDETAKLILQRYHEECAKIPPAKKSAIVFDLHLEFHRGERTIYRLLAKLAPTI